MAINIKTKPAPAEQEQSAHDDAAAEIETEVLTTQTKSGEVLSQEGGLTSEPAPNVITPFERIDVGMSFKMPVAEYTMLEFSVRRSVPFNPEDTDPDTVFGETKAWVEGKLNSLIEEQSGE